MRRLLATAIGILLAQAAFAAEPVDPGGELNPDEMTLLELAQLILKLTGSDSEFQFQPLPEDDPRVRQPDIGRAREILGWSPEVKVEDGLRKTIEDFRPRLGLHQP